MEVVRSPSAVRRNAPRVYPACISSTKDLACSINEPFSPSPPPWSAPVSGVEVLDNVNPVFSYPRIKEVEGHIHVGLQMTTVVDYDIRLAELGNDIGQEPDVCLVANADVDQIRLQLFTSRVDIQADEFCEWSEIAFKKLQAAAVGGADLNESYMAVAEFALNASHRLESIDTICALVFFLRLDIY